MSNWVTVTATNLNAASVAGKVALIRQIATNKSQPDPAPAAITNITAEIRTMIGFSGKYALDQDTTKIPNGLLDLVVKKIVRDMSRVVSLALSDDEKTDERTYESRLDKLRQGLWPVDAPDNPIVSTQVSVGPATKLISSRPRRFSPGQMTGL